MIINRYCLYPTFGIHYNAESSADIKKMLENNLSHFQPLGNARNIAEIVTILKIVKQYMLQNTYLLFVIPNPLPLLSCFLHKYFKAVNLCFNLFSFPIQPQSQTDPLNAL